MTTHEMLCIVQSQLATDLNCTPGDLNGEKDSFIFTEARDNPGRRSFPRSEQHFEMLSMGKSIVVSASPDILDTVKPLLYGKDRDEAFSMPFVYGHSLYYLPDLAQIKPLASPNGFDYEMVEQYDIPELYQYEGFRNAIQYNVCLITVQLLQTSLRSASHTVQAIILHGCVRIRASLMDWNYRRRVKE